MEIKLVEALHKLLADTYALYIKTQNYHWNVVDANFYSLHKLFEEQYSDLAEAVDEIAEQIRKLNHNVTASLSEFSKLTSIPEPIKSSNAVDLLQDLIKDNQTLLASCKAVITVAEGTSAADLAAERIAQHEKNIWFLKSSIK
ncbi:MAG: DNA starvation/stationary phase protection protein [Cardiobacteriaceae bacterium]|nr:DNA starvation/stationary phase protection protein [Cardiobacteriaceae bacterium]